MKKDLFSIILLQYNQEKYIKEALNSILIQSYQNIELIICDDGSPKFKKEKIKKYINKNNNGNIKKTKYIINEKNLGTIKTVNKALAIAKGNYVMMFAADDALYNADVICNFVKCFNNNPKENIITSQAEMYDVMLKIKEYDYVDVNDALNLNKKSALEEYKFLSKLCIYAAGATAYRKLIFKKYGYISEKYKLVEDLSYWLYLTRSGEKIYYHNFIALKHRDGGISKNEREINSVTLDYYYDILILKENEIIKYIFKFSLKEKIEVLDEYSNYLRFLNNKIKNFSKKEKMLILYLSNIDYLIIVIFRKIKKVIKKILTENMVCLIIWFLFNYCGLIIINYMNLIFLFFYFIFTFFMAKIFTKILKIIWRKYK